MITSLSKRDDLFPNRNELFYGMENLFDQIFSDDFFNLAKSHGISPQTAGYPKVNVTSFDDKIEIEAEIPGLSKKDISIETEDRKLIIRGNKKQENDQQKQGVLVYKELKRSSFQRTFILHEDLDISSINASFENAILKITIKRLRPLTTQPERKLIDIK